jgi:virginiamycin A acetyltransferase
MSLEIHESSYIKEPYQIISYDSRKENGELPKIIIGKCCSIAMNCSFTLSNHLTNRFTTSPSPSGSHLFNHGQGNLSSYSKGDIIIGNDVWIGVNCTILDGINIGDGSVIAAGSIVTKDVEPYSIVGGNPAKLIRYRFSAKIIERMIKLKFWDMSMDDIKKINIWSEDIEETISQIEHLAFTIDNRKLG